MRKEVIGSATLYLGDCLDVMPTLQAVDMVLADLPYGTTNCKWDTTLPLPALWQLYSALCMGPVLLFAQTPFDKVLGASNLRDLRYEWIWEKTEATGHLNANKSPLKAHENILVFYRNQPIYRPIKTQGHERKTGVKRSDVSEVYNRQDFTEVPYDSTERFPRSVIRFSTDKQTNKVHPTQKPVALLEYLVSTYTDAEMTVLDNTMGSGSTGVAATRLGRGFVGIEKDADYFDIACTRIENALRQERMFA